MGIKRGERKFSDIMGTIFICFGSGFIISHFFKILWFGDQTAAIGINLILVSSIWLIHNRDIGIATEALQSQRIQITHNMLIQRLEACAELHLDGWEVVSQHIRAGTQNMADSDGCQEWTRLTCSEKIEVIKNQQLDNVNNSLRQIIDNPFKGMGGDVYSVVDTLFQAMYTIDQLPSNNKTYTLWKTYWTEAERKRLISTKHLQFLKDYILLTHHVKELKERGNVDTNLLSAMNKILNEYCKFHSLTY